MALGARPRDVVHFFLGAGGRLVGWGLAFGWLLALFAIRLLRGLVFGVSATDPVTYLAVGFLLLVVGLLACALPAWRGARVDPLRARLTE